MLRLFGDELPNRPFAAADGRVIKRGVRFIAFRQLEGDQALREQVPKSMHERVRD